MPPKPTPTIPTQKPPIRIPQPADFAPLTESHNVHLLLHYPDPPESTTAILILLHGLGDSERPFHAFARSMSLPGVLAISLRGTSPLPPSLLGLPVDSGPTGNFHWGDDLRTAGGDAQDEDGDGLDPDPGFDAAADLIMRRLVGDVLVRACGWSTEDVMLFGYGQGGSLALGLASRLRGGGVGVAQPSSSSSSFKAAISISGTLPPSMVPTLSSRPRATTPILVCGSRDSAAVDADAASLLRREFERVEVVRWAGKAREGMPACREEMLPVMKFFAERLRPPPPPPGVAFGAGLF